MNVALPEVKLEIQKTKNHLMNNCHDTLVGWATINCRNNVNDTQSEFINDLLSEKKKQKSCVLIDDKIYFFPILLVFHTLIVLVLAFVTQLFISDKAITEPL